MQPLLKPQLLEGALFKHGEALGTSGNTALPTSLLPLLVDSYMHSAAHAAEVRMYRVECWRSPDEDNTATNTALAADGSSMSAASGSGGGGGSDGNGDRGAAGAAVEGSLGRVRAASTYTLAGAPDTVVPFCLRVELGLPPTLLQYQQQKTRNARTAMASSGVDEEARYGLPWKTVIADKAFRALQATPELEVRKTCPSQRGGE